MTIQEVITAYGAYYINNGQNRNDIYMQLKRGFVTHQVFTPIVTDSEIWRASEARHTRIVQPFQKAFTPTGSSEFKPVEIRQYNLKADLSEYPDDIKSSWLGFLSDVKVKRTDWPFIKYWMEQLILPQIKQDIELNEIGRGVFVAPTPGTPGPAGTSMNGIQKLLNDHISAGRITPIVLGGIPLDDVELVTYFEEYHLGIPIQYRHIPMTTYTPEDLILRYKRGYEKKYGSLNNFTDNADGTVKIKFTNLTLAGLPSMNLKADGTPNDRIFTTPKSNAIMLSKGLSNANGVFDVQAQDRQVKLLSDWWMGVGFIVPELVWVNDGGVLLQP